MGGSKKAEAARLNQLGEDAMALQRYRLAERYFVDAYNVDREEPLYELNLGRAIQHSPKRPLAMRLRMARVHLELAVKRGPDDADARLHLAGCLEESGDLKAARKHLEKAIELKPYFPEAQTMLNELGKAKRARKARTTNDTAPFGWLFGWLKS